MYKISDGEENFTECATKYIGLVHQTGSGGQSGTKDGDDTEAWENVSDNFLKQITIPGSITFSA